MADLLPFSNSDTQCTYLKSPDLSRGSSARLNDPTFEPNVRHSAKRVEKCKKIAVRKITQLTGGKPIFSFWRDQLSTYLKSLDLSAGSSPRLNSRTFEPNVRHNAKRVEKPKKNAVGKITQFTGGKPIFSFLRDQLSTCFKSPDLSRGSSGPHASMTQLLNRMSDVMRNALKNAKKCS